MTVEYKDGWSMALEYGASRVVKPAAPVVDPDALVPTLAMAAVRRVFEHGHRTRYAALDNGDEPDTRDRVYHLRKADSHMGEYRSGERRDEETGESPLAHVIGRLLLALEHDLRGRQ